jgi:hypothetical protein
MRSVQVAEQAARLGITSVPSVVVCGKGGGLDETALRSVLSAFAPDRRLHASAGERSVQAACGIPRAMAVRRI